jgi:hypothetical protein
VLHNARPERDYSDKVVGDPLRSGLKRAWLTLLGLVLAPSLCVTSARAGYVSSDRIFADSVSCQAESPSAFGLFRERPPLVVAGSASSICDQGSDMGDESIHSAAKDRLSASLVCLGSGRSRPVPPVARKLPSGFDVVFCADSSAPRSAAVRLATYGNRVVIYHPCCDRLFRPPRLVGC